MGFFMTKKELAKRTLHWLAYIQGTFEKKLKYLFRYITSGALSDPALFNTVVQHWLLAIDDDRIAVGLSLESPPVCTICKN